MSAEVPELVASPPRPLERPPLQLANERLRFRYREAFGELPHAYETLLQHVIRGDQTFFVRADEVELAWRIYTPLLEERPPIQLYPAGSWGPDAAEQLVGEGGWYNPSF
jgi:glucose-6-phosphate 1-dehydrogenase